MRERRTAVVGWSTAGRVVKFSESTSTAARSGMPRQPRKQSVLPMYPVPRTPYTGAGRGRGGASRHRTARRRRPWCLARS